MTATNNTTTASTANLPEFITRTECAAWLKMHPISLGNMASQGRGPKFVRTSHLQGKTLYRVSDVLAWLESNVGGGKPAATATEADAVSQAKEVSVKPAKREPRRRVDAAANVSTDAKQRAKPKRATR